MRTIIAVFLRLSIPKSGLLGKQVYYTVLNKIHAVVIKMMTLSEDGTEVWACSGSTGMVALYKYPRGGAPIAVISSLHHVFTAVTNPALVP